MSGLGSPAARPMNSTSNFFAPSNRAPLFSRPAIRVISRASSEGAADETTTTARFVFGTFRSFGAMFPQGQ